MSYYAIDPVRLTATKDGKDLYLTYTELRVLAFFLSQHGDSVISEEIENFCWGNRKQRYSNIVAVYLNYLRKKGVEIESLGYGTGCQGFRLLNDE